jgi:hypothetical protein
MIFGQKYISAKMESTKFVFGENRLNRSSNQDKTLQNSLTVSSEIDDAIEMRVLSLSTFAQGECERKVSHTHTHPPFSLMLLKRHPSLSTDKVIFQPNTI